MRPLPLLAVLAAVLPPPPAHADSITDQIEQAKQYYAEGDVSGAIGELEFAIQELRGKLGEAYAATFPEPPAGWTAEDGEADQAAAAGLPFLGGGSIVQRSYRADSGEGSIQAQIMTGGSMMQGLASMFMNPQVLAAQPNAKRVRLGKENAVVIYDPAERSGQLMLDVGGKATIMLEGSDIASPDPMVELAGRWDLGKVREIAGL